MQITPAGTLQPIRARRDIDAAANAGSFGGGIRVTERRYNKLIPSFRGGVDTLISVGSDWSPWSKPYNSSGALYESPSPRRYAELDVRLISDSPKGRNGAALAVTLEPIDRGFRIQFSDRVQSNELVELSFSASLYLPSTRFEAYLVDRDLGQGVRQQVEAGDATAEVSGSTDVVRFPVTQGMLVNLTISPSAMTPNGDGFNDRLVVTADIVNLVAQRPIRLQVFDLAGRTVWEATQRRGTGPYSIEWDARRASGTLVSPGSYVVRIEAEGDAATKSSVWVLAILY